MSAMNVALRLLQKVKQDYCRHSCRCLMIRAIAATVVKYYLLKYGCIHKLFSYASRV